MGTKERKVYLEAIRLFAIFFVLYTHTGTYGMHHYTVSENVINYWFSLGLAIISQTCVPLFFMISGAVLLHRQESWKAVYSKRVLRMVLVIFLFVLIQYYYNYTRNPLIGFDAKMYLQLVYSGGAHTQQWFLYAYLAFLMVLPFLQRFAASVPEGKWFLYLLSMRIAIDGLCPILEYYQVWDGVGIEIPLFADAVFYSFMGYYIEHCSDNVWIKGRNILLLLVVAVLAGVKNLQMLNIGYMSGSIDYLGLFTALFAFVIFITIRYVFRVISFPKWLQEVFIFAGNGAFGTYLVEEQLRTYLEPIYLNLHMKIYSYPALLVWLVCCLIVGIVLTNVLKLIPGVKKLL